VKVGIVGSSGFLGLELLRLCAGHPELDVVCAMAASHAGETASGRYPSLGAAYPDLVFEPTDTEPLVGLDLVFLALPHGESQTLVPQLVGRVGAIIDLAADFRLTDPSTYATWYGHQHAAPDLISSFAFGLPELFRAEIQGARAIAAAGCYPTTAALALAPLLRAGLISPDGIIVDAASGVSGAGSNPTQATAFATVDEDFRAYGLVNHRHTPEMEQILGASVLFTPHLAPMSRGILATCYARPVPGGPATTADALAVLAQAYAGEPFVVVAERSPSTQATRGSNAVHLSARVDPRTGWLIVLSALDNLVKGAAGQALQCANVALGLEETAGLPLVGLAP
jgi:N-acetyl-gamma-glutamyl-phosphate reductase